jgi:hypothetical protein
LLRGRRHASLCHRDRGSESLLGPELRCAIKDLLPCKCLFVEFNHCLKKKKSQATVDRKNYSCDSKSIRRLYFCQFRSDRSIIRQQYLLANCSNYNARFIRYYSLQFGGEKQALNIAFQTQLPIEMLDTRKALKTQPSDFDIKSECEKYTQDKWIALCRGMTDATSIHLCRKILKSRPLFSKTQNYDRNYTISHT